MFEAIGTFLYDETNREVLAWLGAFLMGAVAVLVKLKGLLSRKSQVKEAPRTSVHVDNSNKSERTGIFGKARVSAGFIFIGKGVPVVLFVLFAAFVVFVVARASPGLDRHVDARCARDLVLPTDNRAAADALNDRGVYHAKSGDFTKALLCYEAAFRRNPNSWPIMQNLAEVNILEPEGDVAEGLRYAGLMVAHQKRKMLEPIRESGLPQSLSCQERGRFTGETFSTVPWRLRVVAFVKLDDLWSAISEMNDLLEAYPPESCLYPQVQANTVLYRTDLLCLSGESDAAIEGFEWLQGSLAFQDDETKRTYQGLMKASGHYSGAVDGRFGDGSRAALRQWVLDGCPGARDFYWK